MFITREGGTPGELPASSHVTVAAVVCRGGVPVSVLGSPDPGWVVWGHSLPPGMTQTQTRFPARTSLAAALFPHLETLLAVFTEAEMRRSLVCAP